MHLTEATVTSFRNFGNGTFGSGQSVGRNVSGASTLQAVDLDLDGFSDLAVQRTAPNGSCNVVVTLGLFQNLAVSGGIFFGPEQQLADALFTQRQFVVGDIDGDADPDLVVSGFSQSTTCGISDVGVQRALNLRTLGDVPCNSTPNSTGFETVLAVSGSETVALNAFVLTATELPPSAFGLMLSSRSSAMVSNPGGSQGILCLGGAVGRFNAMLFSGAPRTFRLAVNLNALPTPMGNVSALPGQTWYFQAWHRDSVSGTATSNFSNSVEVTFR